jgi:PAS domain S-box-containing protein
MSDHDPISTFPEETETLYSRSLASQWRRRWTGSLRFRLLALGLMPLLVAFPLVIAALVVLGGQRAQALLESNLRSHLAASRNYLSQVKLETGVRVTQLARSERMRDLLAPDTPQETRQRALAAAAESSGLDYLLLAMADGRVLGANTPVAEGARLPDSFVIRQAAIGVANAAYEVFDAQTLNTFSAAFPELARVPLALQGGKAAESETRGLLINAAAHFPLGVDTPDAILLGGVLLNRNNSLIEHMREIIYPVGSLPDDAEGITAIALGGVHVAMSHQRQQGHRVLGTPVNDAAFSAVMTQGNAWHSRLVLDGAEHLAAYEPIVNGDGQRVGMLGVAFPYAPYQNSVQLLMWMVGALLALTMLAISLAFLFAGQQLTQRLAHIGQTMSAVRRGNRHHRVASSAHQDELEQLARHFNVLLDTIAIQDAAQHQAQQTIADEASRRRALFEHERDGVVILNADGTVFEANPKSAAMLGYTGEEMQGLHVSDWDAHYSADEVRAIIQTMGPAGEFLQTVHRRKDGSTYDAEVSISLATWGDKTFVFMLQRDISERKVVEAELEQYRRDLEILVGQRTQELFDRSEQLNTIFALSPDGFVSFNHRRQVNFANEAFLRMTGLSVQDVVGLSEAAFAARMGGLCRSAEDFPDIASLRQAQLRQEDEPAKHAPKAQRHQLLELTAAGNRMLELDVRVSESANVSLVLYFRDVTHETEVDRMKSEFLSTAAHELRTPMASIYGFSELLLARKFSEEQRRDLLETISRQATRMSTIIDELLDLARIEARQGKDFVLATLPLQALVKQVLGDYNPPTGRTAPSLDAGNHPLQVRADSDKLQQALLNVVSNAYKYSPEGGEVQVRCLWDEAGQRAGVEISDQGLGMTPEQVARLFERFYRADTSGQIPGTGLGMSIVKEIVELHGGQIDVRSAHGQGTTITLWLPVWNSATAHSEDTEPATA